MDSDFPNPAIYVEHPGTLRVSARHTALPLAKSLNELLETTTPVDLVYMGALAGHVAIKAAAIVGYQLQGPHLERQATTTIVLQPFKVRVAVATNDPSQQYREATVLRVWALTLPIPTLLAKTATAV